MAISFSGLASGLDTSSWVKSLTALKQAKVTTLQEQKQKATTSLDTLTRIKSFFTSFRSLLEKVTDTRFGIASMDLFSQNIANSANLNVLTASVTHEAEEGTYQVAVNKLASNTTASSKYVKPTVQVESSIADKNTLLKDLGVKEGRIDIVNNDGSPMKISITNLDTIGTFIKKLNNSGISADYNEKTGIFSTDIDARNISDYGNTGIKDVLHLQSVPETWQSNRLQIATSQTVTEIASANTKLTELGIRTGTLDITLDTGRTVRFSVGSNTTIQDLVNNFNTYSSYGVNAEYKNGIFSLQGAEITNDNGTGLIDTFGLEGGVTQKHLETGALTITETVNADRNTTLQQLGINLGVLTVDSYGKPSDVTKTFAGTSTIGDVFDWLSNKHHYECNIENGTITIDGNYSVTGSIADALGLSSSTYTTIIECTSATSTDSVTYTALLNATMSTTLGELGVTHYDLTINSQGSSIGSTLTLSEDTTLGNLASTLNSRNIAVTLEDGVLSFKSKVNGVALTVSGGLANDLGVTEVQQSFTLQNSQSSSSALTYTLDRAVTMSDTLSSIVSMEFLTESIGNTILYVNSSSGQSRVTIGPATTLANLANTLNQWDIKTSVDSSGVIHFDSMRGHFVSANSPLAQKLGISAATSKTVGMDATSTIAVTYTHTVTATGTTTLAALRYHIDGTITASGVTGNVIGLSSVDDLNNLSNLVYEGNSMAGKTFVLLNDIDFGGKEFYPIGEDAVIGETPTTGSIQVAFSGKFDGLGHTISNIANKTAKALLFDTTDGAVIKNLKISNSSITQSYSNIDIAGGLVRIANKTIIDGVTIENCNIKNSSTMSTSCTGGIVGDMTGGTIMNCQTIGGTISANKGTVGGIVGAVHGIVQSATGIGGSFTGIVLNPNTNITGCKNGATLTTSGSGGVFGGIAGQVDTSSSKTVRVNFTDCLNVGTINNKSVTVSSGASPAYRNVSAGIVADVTSNSNLTVNFTNCVNNNTSFGGSGSYLTKVAIFGFKSNIINTIGSGTTVNLNGCLSMGATTSSAYNTYSNRSDYTINATNVGKITTTGFSDRRSEFGFGNQWAYDGDLLVSNEYQVILEPGSNYGYSTLSFNGTTSINEMKNSVNSHVRSSTGGTSGNLGANLLGLQFQYGQLSFNSVVTTENPNNGITATATTTYNINSSSGIAKLLNTESALVEKQVATMTEETTIGELRGTKNPSEINSEILASYDSSSPGSSIKTFRPTGTTDSFTIMHNGTERIIAISSAREEEQTIADLISQLEIYGITASVNNGKITLSGDDNTYIVGSKYSDLFHINSNSYSVVKTSSHTNDITFHDDVHNYSGDTLLSEMGMGLDSYTNVYITLRNDATGALRTMTIKTTETSINDLANRLGDYGITAKYNESTGKLTISAQHNYSGLDSNKYHIEGMTTALHKALKLNSDYFTKTVTITTSNSDSKLLQTSETRTLNNDTTWNDLSNRGRPNIVIKNNSGFTTISAVNVNHSVSEVINKLNAAGVQAYIQDGKLHLNCSEGVSIESANTAFQNMFDIVIEGNKTVDVTRSSNSTPLTYNTSHAATENSKLSELGITNGYFGIVKDGVRYNVQVTDDTTMGDLMDTFDMLEIYTNFGVSSGLELLSPTDFDIVSTPGGSNIADVLFSNAETSIQTEFKSTELGTPKEVQVRVDADKNTLLNALDVSWGDSTLKAEGKLSVTVDGVNHTLDIMSHETVGSFMEKLQNIGLEAVLSDGKLNIYSKDKEFSFNTSESTSNLINNIGLVKTADSGISSSDELNVKHEYIANKEFSAANWADDDTKMSLLNISSGNLSIFRDGQKADITINENETFEQLRERIQAQFSDIDLRFVDGKLTLSSSSGAQIVAGATSDTSNIASICGFSTDSKGNVQSARELYRVNGSSKITTSGLFRAGDVSEGSFTIGDAEFNIDSSTTINDLISQINSSEGANATAYWDSIKGEFVIKSRTTGASLINIEAGSSDFTDILGYTSSDGGKKLNTQAQTLGSNAEFTINGTKFTATSNTITSDISKIKGVTLNLKGISEGGSTTLTIEKDTETAANAVEEIVEAYNQLIENVDNEVKAGGDLANQTTLKLIRNQIRSLMTSSIATTGVFKNLNAIGIQLEAASTNNISTANINKLTFNKDKFSQAFNSDRNSLKALLVGDDTMKGVFTRVEEVVENAVGGVAGYFASTENSMNNKIQKLDAKIQKTQTYVDRYQARLEKKFSAMDLLISKIQQQYSSFLS